MIFGIKKGDDSFSTHSEVGKFGNQGRSKTNGSILRQKKKRTFCWKWFFKSKSYTVKKNKNKPLQGRSKTNGSILRKKKKALPRKVE